MENPIFFVIFILFVAVILYLGFSKKGKELMFGGKIIKTYDGISAKKRIVSAGVKVHVIETSPKKSIGLELTATSVGSYQMLPITLPIKEARALADLINQAAEYADTR